MALPTANERSERLYAAAEARAEQHGLRFDEGADIDIKNLTKGAAA
jgi:hypothetical protein